MRVLVTRPRDSAEATAERLRRMGYEPVIVPVLEIVPLPVGISHPEAFGALIATSANAFLSADAFPPTLRALPVWCVGETTARAAESAGFSEIRTGPGTASDLVAKIAADSRSKDRPLLYLSGRETAFDLAGALTARGIAVETVEIYAAEPPAALAERLRPSVARDPIDAVTVYSRRSCEALIAALDAADLTGRFQSVPLLTLSENAAEPAREAGFRRILVAERPREDALFARLADLAAETGRT